LPKSRKKDKFCQRGGVHLAKEKTKPLSDNKRTVVSQGWREKPHRIVGPESIEDRGHSQSSSTLFALQVIVASMSRPRPCSRELFLADPRQRTSESLSSSVLPVRERKSPSLGKQGFIMRTKTTDAVWETDRL
jgi:hypothetical protein